MYGNLIFSTISQSINKGKQFFFIIIFFNQKILLFFLRIAIKKKKCQDLWDTISELWDITKNKQDIVSILKRYKPIAIVIFFSDFQVNRSKKEINLFNNDNFNNHYFLFCVGNVLP